MHKSMLGTLVIDCRTDDLDGAAQFWARALGREVVHRDQPGDEHYRGLAGDPSEPRVLMQKVDHPSRVHMDIETDDVEAEVERLVRLGARKLDQVRHWWVLEAPSGQRFCVVPRQRPDFDDKANVW